MKTKRSIKQYLLLIVLTVGSMFPAFAQQIDLNKTMKAGELKLFQELNNPKVWYYLVDKPKLARDENGIPKFSFLRYVQNVRSGPKEKERREGDGGGIVHALIELGVTQEQRQDAEIELQNVIPEAKIMGPIMYKSGTFKIISSFVKEDDSDLSKQVVVGSGKVPILDGQRTAFSIELTKKGAKILWESFKTPTPDMSVSFDMKMEGYKTVSATIEANFDRIYKHKSFQVGIATPIFGADIQGAFDDMFQQEYIKVTQIGADTKLEDALKTAYNKIFELMFKPVDTGQDQPNANKNHTNMFTTATNMLKERRTDAKNGGNQNGTAGGSTANGKGKPGTGKKKNLPVFASAGAFRMKKVRQTGIFKVVMDKSILKEVEMPFSENLGNIRCKPCFRQVNLDDPFFKQRELVAFIDGTNATDFGDYINFVSLSMRKKHQSGAITNDEVRIDRKNFNKEGNHFKLLYGWKGDNNRRKWIDYEYKTAWNFFGGHTIETDWVKADHNAIGLSPPLLRKTVIMEANSEAFTASGIRVIDVLLFYRIGDKQYTKSTMLRKGDPAKSIDIILPKDVNDYEYEIFWTLKGNKRISSGKQKTNSSLLFVDELPKQELAQK